MPLYPCQQRRSTEAMPADSYGLTASLRAGFRRFVAARAHGHLLVASALTRQPDTVTLHCRNTTQGE